MKKAKKKPETKKPKKPKPEKPGKPAKPEGDESGDASVSFNRVELQQLLLGIAELTPGGAGSISQQQHDAIKQKLDVYFGEEPVTLTPTETEGEPSNV